RRLRINLVREVTRGAIAFRQHHRDVAVAKVCGAKRFEGAFESSAVGIDAISNDVSSHASLPPQHGGGTNPANAGSHEVVVVVDDGRPRAAATWQESRKRARNRR